MELKQFIKTALVDIIEAVKETQDKVKDCATIVPLVGNGSKDSSVLMKDGVAKISNIDFDIAVTTESKESGHNDVGAQIKVAGIFKLGVGGADGSESSLQNISRIQFSIPVLLPHSACLEEVIEVSHNKTTTRRLLPDNQGR